MQKTIRIGTRGSQLALWQAHTVKTQLELQGYATELIIIKSTGDLVLDTPLYELGTTGIFTKALDIAMIKGKVDIAVHSMKDVPTKLPKGIVKAAVLHRAHVEDILVYKTPMEFRNDSKPYTIASGSLRRKAQWLRKYPHHTVVNLRGNVSTRLQKLQDKPWDGAIFAKAGLERVQLLPEYHQVLDWMIPAPAQGAMLAVAMENDHFSREALSALHHKSSDICTHIERAFLRELEGGCTAPIGALALIQGTSVYFKGALYSPDGRREIKIERNTTLNNIQDFGASCAQEILNNGGHEIIQQIKKNNQK